MTTETLVQNIMHEHINHQKQVRRLCLSETLVIERYRLIIIIFIVFSSLMLTNDAFLCLNRRKCIWIFHTFSCKSGSFISSFITFCDVLSLFLLLSNDTFGSSVQKIFFNTFVTQLANMVRSSKDPPYTHK